MAATLHTLQGLRAYCATKPGCQEDAPFGPDTLVFKVGGKMFALCDVTGDNARDEDDTLESPLTVTLKCEPGLAELLCAEYDAVTPGYHMNKRHWNTITLDGSLPEALAEELIDCSYDLVVAGLTTTERERVRA